jgi:SAM-dependent methyltransferase
MNDIAQESTLSPHDDVGWQASPSRLKLDYLHRYASGQTALDLGCGRGWYASALADMGLAVTGIDQANQVDDLRITVLEQPIAVPLPFADGAFDTVLMFDILEHLPDEAGVLGEVARVCRRRLILSVPHADDGFLPRYGLTYLHHTDKTHLRLYTPDSLRSLLDGYGFEALRVALEGGPTIPLAFAEFVWGGPLIRGLARYTITALYKIGLVQNKSIAGDIFYVGERRGQE